MPINVFCIYCYIVWYTHHLPTVYPIRPWQTNEVGNTNWFSLGTCKPCVLTKAVEIVFVPVWEAKFALEWD